MALLSLLMLMTFPRAEAAVVDRRSPDHPVVRVAALPRRAGAGTSGAGAPAGVLLVAGRWRRAGWSAGRHRRAADLHDARRVPAGRARGAVAGAARYARLLTQDAGVTWKVGAGLAVHLVTLAILVAEPGWRRAGCPSGSLLLPPPAAACGIVRACLRPCATLACWRIVVERRVELGRRGAARPSLLRHALGSGSDRESQPRALVPRHDAPRVAVAPRRNGAPSR